MHPTGQILNHDNRREYQRRVTKNFHAPIPVANTPKTDEDDDEVVTECIGKYITCSLSNTDQYPEINEVEQRVPTLHHTTTCR